MPDTIYYSNDIINDINTMASNKYTIMCVCLMCVLMCVCNTIMINDTIDTVMTCVCV